MRRHREWVSRASSAKTPPVWSRTRNSVVGERLATAGGFWPAPLGWKSKNDRLMVSEWTDPGAKSVSLPTVTTDVSGVHGIIVKSPCVNMKLPTIVRPPVVPLTTEQVGGVMATLPSRYRGLALVSAGAGLRPGEARGLTVPWFNFLKRELRVEQQLWTPQTGPSYMIRPKRGSVGTIPVGDAVVTGLARYFEELPPSTLILCVSGQEEVLVFTDDKGNPIRRQRWNEAWNRAATKADLPPGATPHDLRRYYASLLISKGASVKAVQTMLRHKTATETLNTYAHLWPEDNALVRRAIDAELSPIVGLSTPDAVADISRTSASEHIK